MRRRSEARPPSSGTSGATPLEVEILDAPTSFGGGEESSATGHDAPRRSARLVAAVIVGSIAAVAAWVLLVDGDDDGRSERPGATTADDLADAAGDAGNAVPAASPALSMPAFDGLAVPTLPTTGSAGGRIDESALAADVLRMTADVPRRSTTRVELGYAGYAGEVTILRDPINDRYEISLDTGSGPSWAVLDVPSATVYYSSDREQWVSDDDGVDVASVPFTRMGDLYRRLLDGPLRPDTLDATTIEATGTAELADGRAADAFTVSVPGPAVPLWQLYYLAPRAEFDPSDLPSTLVYEVYLGEDVEVVVGVSDVGGIPQLVRHELELLPAPVIVRLPEPGAADTGPVDG